MNVIQLHSAATVGRYMCFGYYIPTAVNEQECGCLTSAHCFPLFHQWN